jgi:hypothetical protein
MTGDPMTDGMRQLAEALRAAASAADLIADAVSGTTPDTGPAAPRTAHPVRTGSRTGAVPDAEAVVAALWPPVAVTLARDVEAKENGRYRGRVRWRDPSARGGYRGHSRTFATESAAWAWVSTWTAPPVDRPQEAG